MKTTTKETTRETKTGRYSHSLDVVCVCGARKGEHDAEKPYALDSNNCQAFVKGAAVAVSRKTRCRHDFRDGDICSKCDEARS
jgi:hypothetical protein